MNALGVRRWSHILVMACGAVAALSLLLRFAWHTPDSAQFHRIRLALEVLFAGVAALAAVHEKVSGRLEDDWDAVTRPGARPGQEVPSLARLVLRGFLTISAVLGMLVPVGLLALVANGGRPLTGGEFLIMTLGMPWSAVTSIHVFVESRRLIPSSRAIGWDRAAVMAGPMAALFVCIFVFAPQHEFESLPGRNPWVTSLVALVFAFNAGYALFRSGRRARYVSRRAHASEAPRPRNELRTERRKPRTL